MAVLALDRMTRDFYSQLARLDSHAQWIAYEVERLGRDRAAYTAVLLKNCNLPERICKAVAASHAPQTLSSNTDEDKFARCVCLVSDLAEVVDAPDRTAAVGALARRAHAVLGASPEQFNEVVARVLKLAPETEELYESSIMAADDADNLFAEARELLAVRNLYACRKSAICRRRRACSSRAQTKAEDSSRRDPLTDALNRPWLDRRLDREFTQAVVFGRDLSVAHVDIDRFKAVNDRYGVQVGDLGTARLGKTPYLQCGGPVRSAPTDQVPGAVSLTAMRVAADPNVPLRFPCDITPSRRTSQSRSCAA